MKLIVISAFICSAWGLSIHPRFITPPSGIPNANDDALNRPLANAQQDARLGPPPIRQRPRFNDDDDDDDQAPRYLGAPRHLGLPDLDGSTINRIRLRPQRNQGRVEQIGNQAELQAPPQAPQQNDNGLLEPVVPASPQLNNAPPNQAAARPNAAYRGFSTSSDSHNSVAQRLARAAPPSPNRSIGSADGSNAHSNSAESTPVRSPRGPRGGLPFSPASGSSNSNSEISTPFRGPFRGSPRFSHGSGGSGGSNRPLDGSI